MSRHYDADLTQVDPQHFTNGTVSEPVQVHQQLRAGLQLTKIKVSELNCRLSVFLHQASFATPSYPPVPEFTCSVRVIP